MTDFDKAIAEFLAKNSAVVCAPILSAKQSKEASKATYEKFSQNESENNAMHNAENKRYDSEGVYYIGGMK